MLTWALVTAMAAPAIEEIMVYSDPFARWDGTRWLVETEVFVPFPITISRVRNAAFRSYALQMRAVISCEKDARLGRKRYEVMCTIDDIGLQATTVNRWRTRADIQRVQQVLDNVDEMLTGSRVQLQVDDAGTLRNIDLEGLSQRNERERESAESLRQLVSRLMAGFHLHIPNPGQRRAPWTERNSLLLAMPSSTGIMGATNLDHEWLTINDTTLIRSGGGGTVSFIMPIVSKDNAIRNLQAPEGAAQVSGAAPTSPGPASFVSYGPPDESVNLTTAPSWTIDEFRGLAPQLDVRYKVAGQGFAVFDTVNGYVTERSWLVTGQSLPSSAGGVNTGPYQHAGKMQRLGQTDHPDVGPSQQVTHPRIVVPGVQRWIPLDIL